MPEKPAPEHASKPIVKEETVEPTENETEEEESEPTVDERYSHEIETPISVKDFFSYFNENLQEIDAVKLRESFFLHIKKLFKTATTDEDFTFTSVRKVDKEGGPEYLFAVRVPYRATWAKRGINRGVVLKVTLTLKPTRTGMPPNQVDEMLPRWFSLPVKRKYVPGDNK